MSIDRPIRTLSLFSGAGGLDLGFEQAGFDIRACVEIEAKYCATLQANIDSGSHFSPDTKVFNIDVTQFDETEYVSEGIDCIIGGPPCQTFSAAGRRAGGVIGTEDARGQLYSTYCRILDRLKPKAFVFENVYGLPGANGGGPWREIVSAFAEHGYKLFYEVVDTADFGAPQHRERLIMVGLREGNFGFPCPTHGPDAPTDTPLVSVLDAVNDLQDPKEPYHDDLGGMYGHLLPDVPEGLNYAYFTAEMGHPEPVFAWRSKFHDLLYKVNRNEPCRTIKAQPGKFTGPFHWKNRHFTLDELKRLQTFPDDYILQGTYGVQLEQIGNSVPPRLASVIATALREQVFEKVNDFTYPLRPDGFKSTFRQRQRERSKRFRSIAQAAIESRYGNKPKHMDRGKSKAVKTTYNTEYINLFSRSVVKGEARPGFSGAEITLVDKSNSVLMDFKSKSASKSIGTVEISITGLRKYLPEYDALIATCRMTQVTDIFHIWQEIEKALTARSRFFTLIDIYGHYANRGDVVDVNSNFDFSCKSSPLTKALEYFSQTRNCGDFLGTEVLLGSINISSKELPSMTEALRALRYDFRTSKTHPIIGKERLLCTYPFPLLSPRALVESRVELIERASDEKSLSTVK
ncbi:MULTISPECIES: DNA cytosine methyltransferase [unclassified Roseibium]|uniref:DNA cytosine methyltransferase n=1 Tax=unclassified Roseibium TaxID=2629323 RepID=UPI00273DA6DC|nr:MULTISPECIES: DNA (cytosine-5-)-methyltransferase [unclassified Roseibium]